MRKLQGKPVEERSLAKDLGDFSWQGFVNLLFPNRCAFCSAALVRGSCICEACLKTLEIIQPPVCGRCGAPLAEGGERGAVETRSGAAQPAGRCRHCIDLDFHFRKNESLGVYSGKLRELIHLYKFKRRRSLHRLFALLIHQWKRDFVLEHDALVPVPLIPARLSDRGYNQSFLVARDLGSMGLVHFYGEAMARKGASQPQSGIPSRRDRLANITDDFLLRKPAREALRGRHLLLLDDVLTTGATASRCAEALYEAGAGSVDVLTLARALVEPARV